MTDTANNASSQEAAGEPAAPGDDLFAADRAARRASLGGMSSGRQLWHVAVLSGVGLFCELLLIRWLDAEIRPLAYVKNLPLIASFLGLGIGFAIAGRRRSSFPLSVVLLALVLAVGSACADRFGATLAGPIGPEINLGIRATEEPIELLVFYALITGIFALVVLAMIPLGQIAGEYMEGLETLRCYSANIAGALAGIVLFFALAALSVPPWVGALAVLAICLGYFRPGRLRSLSLVVAAAAVLSMAVVDRSGGLTVWSPYNKIKLQPLPPVELEDRSVDIGWVLGVQNGYYQRMLDLRPETVAAVREQAPVVGQASYAYDYPYGWIRPRKVLVVGAGTGNDVAAALRHGAERVDAVEIDPRILRFGRELHPEGPYRDPRVNLVEADARAFLGSSDEKWDLIVFGLLDSHTSLFSSLSSNIRLDNYVYTVEALADALAHLEPGTGVLSLAFYVEQPWIATRLDLMLREVTGSPPLVTKVYYDGGFLFLAGPGIAGPEGRKDSAEGRPEVFVGVPEDSARQHPAGELATDDWPFLYLERRGVPTTVLRASAGMMAVTVLLVALFFRGRIRFDRHLFFLGAGFLLVETRTIAQLGLVFGSTWRVSAITIAGILTLILVANAIITRTGPLPRIPLYLALSAGLAACYFVPPGVAVGGGSAAAFGLAIFYLLPLVFAALIFASSVSKLEGLAVPLASNLIGAVLGGLLENLSMSLGISALSLLAIVVYGASFRR